jgi:type IV secretory pathway VirJ component
MIKYFAILFLSLHFFSVPVFCQTNKAALPVSVFGSNDSLKPVLFYITGDGGWNRFSNAFVQTLNKKGYAVVGLNAREYFWHKKTAQETANALSLIIAGQMKGRKSKSFVLIGYSFGADVMPFVVTHSGRDTIANLQQVVLMSPSTKTDFEVHLSGMMGLGTSSGESVPAEVNKISKPVLFVFGNKENDFPLKDVHIKNYKTVILPGGHHYDGDPAAVCNIILPFLK